MRTRHGSRPALAVPAALLAALAVLGLTLAACADGGESDVATTGSAADGAAQAPVPDIGSAQDSLSTANLGYRSARDTLRAPGGAPESTGDPDAPTGPSLIRTGTVSLRSDDVGQARFDVRDVLARYDGEIAEDSTEAAKDGEAVRARLVVRVPVADFEAAMDDLRQVATLVQASTNSEDVTTEVIDTDVRVKLQRRSIDRISLLLRRAQNLRDVISIERELSRREADLGSLEKRQSYLDDQTARSTITISIRRTEKEESTTPEKKDRGFLAGLHRGWRALGHATVDTLQGLGVALPFGAVALVVGVPVLAVTRRRRRATA